MATRKLEKFRPVPRGTPQGTPSKLKDARAAFRRLASKAKPDPHFHEAFVKHRHHIAATHPFLSAHQRRSAVSELQASSPTVRSIPEDPPIPGGIGYGMYYTETFRAAFSEGTALYWEIVCPSEVGGNVTDYLYITAMNRASLGVEGLVRYNGAAEPGFVVFDWSLSDGSRLQPEVKFSAMGSYLRQDNAHGAGYQVLPLMNMTYQADDNNWTNQVWLLNHDTDRWDLTYQHTYAAAADAQHGDFVGSWGPIVETFQDAYNGTNGIGALNTQLSTHLNGQWGIWSNLRQADSQPRVDNKGFLPVFLDPNTSWVIKS
jgi:hypothetical protein